MTQRMAEKVRLVRDFINVWIGELWDRKSATARRTFGTGHPTFSQVEACAAEDRGDEVDAHPLFRYRPAQIVIDADRLCYQAMQDLATHDRYPDSERARVFKIAAEQTRVDSKAKAAQALRKWAADLEAMT